MGTLARDGLMLTSIMYDLLQNAEKQNNDTCLYEIC